MVSCAPSRNDLYLTLERGEFERGGKSTAKNIEVCVMVVRDEGRVLEVSVSVIRLSVSAICTALFPLMWRSGVFFFFFW